MLEGDTLQTLFGTLHLGHFLSVAAILFSVGVCGVLINRKNMITLLMSIELMLLAVNINFVSFSVFWQGYTGQVFSMLILTVAAAEAAIGLAILVLYYNHRRSIAITDVSQMRS